MSPESPEIRVVDGLKDYSGVVAAGFNVVEEFSGATSGEAITYPDFSGDYWIDQIGASHVWQYTQGSASSEAVIGIIDSGFPAIPSWHIGSISSDRLSRFNKSGIAIFDNNDSRGHGAEYWHGAFVACMAAADTGFGRGVAWKNRVVSVDVASGTIERASFFKAVKVVVEKGADIINVSLGPATETPRNLQGFRLSWTQAVLYAGINDVLVVFAAGNEGVKNDDRLLPTSTELNKVAETIHITDEHLARAADEWSKYTLIVASVDDSNTEAALSTMGDVVNIAAPGVDVGCGLEDFTDENVFYLTDSGTSYAAPLVAGTAALMKSVNPSLTAPEIRSIILETASANINLRPGSSHPDIQLNACEAMRAAAPIATRDNMSCGCDTALWPETAGGPDWKDATADDVAACLDAGVDVNAIDEDDWREWTALHFAAQSSTDPLVIDALVDGGADVNEKGEGSFGMTFTRQPEWPGGLHTGLGCCVSGIEDVTPMHLAALSLVENPEVVTALANAGADLNAYDMRSYRYTALTIDSMPELTPLHYATASNSTADAIALINAGANVNARRSPGQDGWDYGNFRGDTPLHFAALYGNVDLITALIHGGADANARNVQGLGPDYYDGHTPLDYVDCDYEAAADVLLGAGAKCTWEPGKGTACGLRVCQCSSWCTNNTLD